MVFILVMVGLLTVADNAGSDQQTFPMLGVVFKELQNGAQLLDGKLPVQLGPAIFFVKRNLSIGTVNNLPRFVMA